MKILAQIGICILLGTIIGIAFWLCDGGKARPGVSGGQERASRDEIRVTRGVWHKDFLEVIK